MSQPEHDDLMRQAEQLAERFWRIHPKEILDMVPPITRQDFYANEIKKLILEALLLPPTKTTPMTWPGPVSFGEIYDIISSNLNAGNIGDANERLQAAMIIAELIESRKETRDA